MIAILKNTTETAFALDETQEVHSCMILSYKIITEHFELRICTISALDQMNCET